MAVPTIIALSRTSGPTGGKALVEVTATGLRTPSTPPSSGPVPAPAPTVEVLFGGEPAAEVRVITQGRLWCLTPIHDPGTVDVVVRNLDDLGDPIAGEEATAAAAYTFERPDLVGETDLQRVVRAYITEFRRQVLANTVISTHVDYVEDPQADAHFANLAELPAIVLVGPRMSENRFYSKPRGAAEEYGADVLVRRPPYTVDLEFSLLVGADSQQQAINLVHAVTMFYHRNQWLSVPRDPNDPTKGSVTLELGFTPSGDLAAASTPNASNLIVFSGDTFIRAVDLDELAATEDAAAALTRQVTEPVIEVQHTEGETAAVARLVADFKFVTIGDTVGNDFVTLEDTSESALPIVGRVWTFSGGYTTPEPVVDKAKVENLRTSSYDPDPTLATLTVWDSAGNKGEVTKQVYPVIDATFWAQQESGLLVNFIDQSVALVNGAHLVGWQWDLDDGGVTPSTEQNPSYTYPTELDEFDEHRVKLIVTDSLGNQAGQFVRVNAAPTVTELLDGVATNVPANPGDEYAWFYLDLPDYPGIPQVTFRFESPSGGEYCGITANPFSGFRTAQENLAPESSGLWSETGFYPSDFPVEYVNTEPAYLEGGTRWYVVFKPDNSISAGDVVITATVTAYEARFTSAVGDPTVGEMLFTDASVDIYAAITDWEYDFGDGSPVSTGVQNPSHQYATGGEYTVTLTVTDARDETAQVTKTIFVPLLLNNGESTAFDFGVGGVPDEDATLRHYYVDVGAVPDFDIVVESLDADVRLMAHPGGGLVDPDTAQLNEYIQSYDPPETHTVTDPAEAVWFFALRADDGPVVGSFRVDVPDFKAGFSAVYNGSTDEVDFTDASVDIYAAITDWEYDFGDGSPVSTGVQNPSHQYASPGDYSVTLTITDARDETAQVTKTVTMPDLAGATELQNGVAETDLSGGSAEFYVAVPQGATNLQFVMSGGTGDADLHVKKGDIPTTSDYDYRPFAGGNDESVAVPDGEAPGLWGILIAEYSAWAGVDLVVTWTEP